jgi:hypothetical protein
MSAVDVSGTIQPQMDANEGGKSSSLLCSSSSREFEDDNEGENDRGRSTHVLTLPSLTPTFTICSIRASEFWRRVHG